MEHHLHLRRLAAALIGALLLGFAATPAHAAGVPDKWVRWIRVPDLDPTRDERSTWVRSLDSIGPLLYAGSEGDGVFTSPVTGIGPWLSVNDGLDDDASRMAVREVVSGGGQLYAATTAGLFKTFVGGSWQPVSQDAGPRRLNMGGIQAVHFNAPPTDQDIVVGTASHGVWYSSDFGQSWDRASGMPSSETVFDFAANPGVLYAAGADGIYASVDFGRSWILASDGIPPSETVLRVATKPGDVTTLYASTSGGIYKTANAGITWEDAGGAGADATAIGDDHVRALVLGPPQLGGGRLFAGTEKGVWATPDDGRSWGQMSPETLIDPDPVDPAPDPLPFGQQIVWALGLGAGGSEGINLMAGTQASGVYSIDLQGLVSRGPPPVTPSTSVEVGEKLTATPGSWAGSRPFFFTYQWLRCNDRGVSCAAIAGATGTTYTLTDLDQGRTVKVRVAGRNIMGSNPVPVTSAQTPTSGTVGPTPGVAPAPVNLSTYPTITPNVSTPAWGQTFTVNNGTWRYGGANVTPAFSYQWQRCDGNASRCTDLAGATRASYTTVPADVGGKMRAHITATYFGVSTTLEAGTTFTLIEKTPVNTDRPRIVGDAWIGRKLSSSAGGWSANRPSFERRWLRCNDEGVQCNPTSPVQTGSTYALTEADRGSRLQLEVTAIVRDPNQDRRRTEYSEFTPVIGDAPPEPVDGGGGGGGPVGGGDPGGGRTGPTVPGARTAPRRTQLIALSVPKHLKVGAGIGAPRSVKGFRKLRYQWYRNGKKIKKATKRTYRLTRADRGKKIVCKITMTPAHGGRPLVRTSRAIVFKVEKKKAKKKHHR